MRTFVWLSTEHCGRCGAESIGHGGTGPHFYKRLGTRGTVKRRTANKKLTKPTEHHETAHQYD